MQRSTEKPVLTTRLHNRKDMWPAVQASMENDSGGRAVFSAAKEMS